MFSVCDPNPGDPSVPDIAQIYKSKKNITDTQENGLRNMQRKIKKIFMYTKVL